ncbi:MAG: cytochrome c [Gammaproteobacteria bacterium]|nr:cytochrome c [Gammaproteobacteria bacterium]
MKFAVAKIAFIVGSVVTFLAAPFALQAESSPEDIIKYRQNMMKANGAHMAAMGAVIQGKVDYKKDLADHARALQAINKNIPALFPKGSDFGGETKALDAIWQKNADFEKLAKQAGADADALAKAVQTGDAKVYGPKFKALADDCKACHKDFRKKDEAQ